MFSYLRAVAATFALNTAECVLLFFISSLFWAELITLFKGLKKYFLAFYARYCQYKSLKNIKALYIGGHMLLGLSSAFLNGRPLSRFISPYVVQKCRSIPSALLRTSIDIQQRQYDEKHHLGLSEKKCKPLLPTTVRPPNRLMLLHKNKPVPFSLKTVPIFLHRRQQSRHVLAPNTLVLQIQKRWQSTLPRLPIGIQTFSKLRDENFAYVDKTPAMLKLITEGSGRYFYGAMRRVGKSLFISALEELFLGNKKYFNGLSIDLSNYKWEKYPVIKLDFSTLNKSHSKALTQSLLDKLKLIGENYRITLQHQEDINDATFELIYKLSENKAERVVVLVDEYDSPIVEHIEDGEKAKENIHVLRSFFTTIKGLDKYIKFIFVTGVSRFSHVTLFSGMNLDDISMKSKYGSLVGYTEKEVMKHLSAHIDNVAKRTNRSFEQTFSQMREWYNGYRFSEDSELVYNPWSVLRFLDGHKFTNYWFESGTPTFAIKSLSKSPYMLETLQESIENTFWITESQLTVKFEVHEAINYPVVLLFQTGYLTIKDYNAETRSYALGFPNKEVRESFIEYLLPYVAHKSPEAIIHLKKSMTQALSDGNIHRFLDSMRALIADIPYQIHSKEEGYYHTIVLLTTRLLGFESTAEVQTNRGSIDLAVKAPHFIYVMEFKINRTGKAAIDQVVKNEYWKKFQHDPRQLILIGLSFDTKTRDIRQDWIVERVEKP